jgi:hypothetical protein
MRQASCQKKAGNASLYFLLQFTKSFLSFVYKNLIANACIKKMPFIDSNR